MSGSQVPKEQEKYLENLSSYMRIRTNMTEEQAWSFALRCWQFKDKEEFKRRVFGDE